MSTEIVLPSELFRAHASPHTSHRSRASDLTVRDLCVSLASHHAVSARLGSLPFPDSASSSDSDSDDHWRPRRSTINCDIGEPRARSLQGAPPDRSLPAPGSSESSTSTSIYPSAFWDAQPPVGPFTSVFESSRPGGAAAPGAPLSGTQPSASGRSEAPSSRDDARPLPPVQDNSFTWYGPDMASRKQEWCVPLTPDEISELVGAAKGWLRGHVGVATEDIAVAAAADFPLPQTSKLLGEVRGDLMHGRGFVVLRGLPIRRLSERVVVTIFSGIGAHLGVARSQDAFGHVIAHVRDAGLSSADPHVRIYQTRERQGFHCDWADVVGLLCIKPAMRGGKTLLVSSATLFNEMRRRRPDLLAALFEPIATDRRGEVSGDEAPFNCVPVFSWHEGYLTALYHRPYIESAQRFPDAPRLTERQREALDLLDDLANSPDLSFSLWLNPGDMQFVYNHALLHDRTAYEDWPGESEKRHLLRMWLALPGDRPLPPAFASRYGSVEVGNRGGVKVSRFRQLSATRAAEWARARAGKAPGASVRLPAALEAPGEGGARPEEPQGASE